MIEYILYVTSLFIVFYINLRILHAIRIEKKFEKMKLWEIRAAYFIMSITIAHIISDMLLRLTKIVELI